MRSKTGDALVDTANLLAEQAAADLRAMPPGGTLQDSHLAQEVAAYRRREKRRLAILRKD